MQGDNANLVVRLDVQVTKNRIKLRYFNIFFYNSLLLKNSSGTI